MPVLKGAFIKLDAGLLGFAPDVIIFQFNPETVSRNPSLAFPTPPAEGSGPRNVNEQPAEPTESLGFALRLDATDALVSGDPVAGATGILPALSALELLLYPKSALLSDLFGGTSQPYQNPPGRLPTVLFFWGASRVLPVNVTSLSIQETEYDQLLNPVRAEVNVNLQVLTPSQLPEDARLERGAYRYTQGVKEVMAAANLLSPPDVITKTLSTF